MFSFHASLLFHLSSLVVLVLRAGKEGMNEVSILCSVVIQNHFSLSNSFMFFTSKIPQS